MKVNIIEELNILLAQLTGLSNARVEAPADLNHGDLTTNVVMRLAAQNKQPWQQLAEKLSQQLQANKLINQHFAKVQAVKPGFINFFYSQDYLKDELKKIIKTADYGRENIGKGKTIVVEYSSPNTNKPLHLGHLRNDAIGMALAKIFEYLGYKVKKVSVINDRGIHIMQSLLSYMKWGKGDTPAKAGKKGDHFVGDYYVRFNEELAKESKQHKGADFDRGDFSGTLSREARELLVKWENGDPEVRRLWQQMNKWVYDGWEQTYKRYGSDFDKKYFESELYNQGKEIINKAVEDKIAYKNATGAIVIDLSKYGLGGIDTGEKVLIRQDGTSLYMTQDIYLAKQRYDDYKFDKMFYVVADEQNYHFKALFKILELLGFDWVDRCHHYSYGMVDLPSGKMKSREGTVIDADDLLDELAEMAKQEVNKRRDDLKTKEIDDISEKVALSAIKYWFLKSNPKSRILFNPKESIDFEGNTGPYLLYTYVRLNSILHKAQKVSSQIYKLDVPSGELKLIREMVVWPYVVRDFLGHYNTNIICEYLYRLASSLNSYYQSVPVLRADGEIKDLRLQIIAAGSKILKTGLGLLNIDTLERM